MSIKKKPDVSYDDVNNVTDEQREETMEYGVVDDSIYDGDLSSKVFITVMVILFITAVSVLGWFLYPKDDNTVKVGEVSVIKIKEKGFYEEIADIKYDQDSPENRFIAVNLDRDPGGGSETVELGNINGQHLAVIQPSPCKKVYNGVNTQLDKKFCMSGVVFAYNDNRDYEDVKQETFDALVGNTE